MNHLLRQKNPKPIKMKHHFLHSEAGKAVSYKQLKITSDAFENKRMIPAKYTCDGENINPPLRIANIPKETQCLVIIVDDLDTAVNAWTHWIMWNIPVTHRIKENEIHGVEGINDFQQRKYSGPCPPLDTHRYSFRVYAVDKMLDIPSHTRKPRLETEISGHIIAMGELIGLYGKDKYVK
jgi:Raf kinase inhibitor-like YbhB/YbcL family protein